MEKVQWNSINKKQNGLEQSKNDIIHEKCSNLPYCPMNVTNYYSTKRRKAFIIHAGFIKFYSSCKVRALMSGFQYAEKLSWDHRQIE